MKRVFTSLLLAGFFGTLSFSQSTIKIGHVDIAQILASLPSRDSAAAKLNKETREMQSTYDEMTVMYNKLLDDYEKGQSTFSEPVKKNKESELFDKEKRLKEFEQNASETLQKRNSELIQPIINDIIKAVNKVATENNFTYILDVSKGSVVFTSKDSQDINPLVMQVLKPATLPQKINQGILPAKSK
jgi:outer membrane protein